MTDKAKLEKLKKLADKMYDAAFNLTTDASLLRKAMDDYHQFIINEYHKEEPVSGNIDFEKELYKAFGQVKDFTLCMQIAKWFYDMGRNSKDCQEPVSEELEKAANEWNTKASFTPFYMALDDNGNPYEVRQDYTTHAESFKAGAQWQKEKDQNK